jgi:hypothetical protein
MAKNVRKKSSDIKTQQTLPAKIGAFQIYASAILNGMHVLMNDWRSADYATEASELHDIANRSVTPASEMLAEDNELKSALEELQRYIESEVCEATTGADTVKTEQIRDGVSRRFLHVAMIATKFYPPGVRWIFEWDGMPLTGASVAADVILALKEREGLQWDDFVFELKRQKVRIDYEIMNHLDAHTAPPRPSTRNEKVKSKPGKIVPAGPGENDCDSTIWLSFRTIAGLVDETGEKSVRDHLINRWRTGHKVHDDIKRRQGTKDKRTTCIDAYAFIERIRDKYIISEDDYERAMSKLEEMESEPCEGSPYSCLRKKGTSHPKS